MSIQRYIVIGEMKFRPEEGEYVLYSDHIKTIEELNQRLIDRTAAHLKAYAELKLENQNLRIANNNLKEKAWMYDELRK